MLSNWWSSVNILSLCCSTVDYYSKNLIQFASQSKWLTWESIDCSSTICCTVEWSECWERLHAVHNSLMESLAMLSFALPSATRYCISPWHYSGRTVTQVRWTPSHSHKKINNCSWRRWMILFGWDNNVEKIDQVINFYMTVIDFREVTHIQTRYMHGRAFMQACTHTHMHAHMHTHICTHTHAYIQPHTFIPWTDIQHQHIAYSWPKITKTPETCSIYYVLLKEFLICKMLHINLI